MFITSQCLDWTTGKVKIRDSAKCEVRGSEAYGSEKNKIKIKTGEVFRFSCHTTIIITVTDRQV
jgi:hypothetical protein